MKQENIQILLNQIAEVIAFEKELDRKKHASGEGYDVFKVMNVQTKEVVLHSAIISDLLNPNGCHGQGTMFLEAFLGVLDDFLTVRFDNLKKVSVTPEYNIGPISNDWKRGGRIDILITDGKKAIVIENKIYAQDQKNQLLRYDTYCKETFSEYDLIYLNLYITNPSDYSLGKKDIECISASYREDINEWLVKCIELCAEKPTLRYTLKQYQSTIEEITGTMSSESTEKLIAVALDSKNIEPVLELFNNEYEIRKKIRLNFLYALQEAAKKYGLTCNDGVFEDIANLKKNTFVEFTTIGGSGKYCLGIGNEDNEGFYYSIYPNPTSSEQCRIDFLRSLHQIWGLPDTKRKNKSNPYGWEYLFGEDGQSGSWWNWDYCSTLLDMHNGKLLAFIEQEIFKKCQEGNLLGILEENIG